MAKQKKKAVEPNKTKAAEKTPEKTIGERLRATRARNVARLPAFGAEMAAIGREAIKDVRNELHNVFFSKNEGASEPGTPLNPTPQELTASREIVDFKQVLDHFASRGSVHGPEKVKSSPEVAAPKANKSDRNVEASRGSVHGKDQETAGPTAASPKAANEKGTGNDFNQVLDQYAAGGSVHGQEQDQSPDH